MILEPTPTDPFIVPEMTADRRLRLFTLCVDFAAADRARRVADTLTQLAGGHWESSTEMWNLNSPVAGESIQETIVREAAAADVLIVAVSSMESREPKLIQWLDSLAAPDGNRQYSGLFIGLLGDEDSGAEELGWTVRQFLRCAQRTDRDFIWHWMGSKAATDDGWLVNSVESLLSRKCFFGDVPFLQEAAWG